MNAGAAQGLLEGSMTPIHVRTGVTRFEQFCLDFQTGLCKFAKFVQTLRQASKKGRKMAKI